MNALTYKQAFDKITEAYIKGEIKPMDCDFCFCGTLAGGSQGWCVMNPLFYKASEYDRMERALFDGLSKVMQVNVSGKLTVSEFSKMARRSPNYEDALFAGMAAALEVLRQIHIERGEIIDEVPVFTKRQLATL